MLECASMSFQFIPLKVSFAATFSPSPLLSRAVGAARPGVHLVADRREERHQPAVDLDLPVDCDAVPKRRLYAFMKVIRSPTVRSLPSSRSARNFFMLGSLSIRLRLARVVR